MDAKQIALWRMHNLRLAGNPLQTPEAVVRWLGAVQSQDFGPAKWSTAQRTSGFDDADLNRRFNEGKILRTHVLRPTWHFVLPEDIRLMLQVTGPRVQVANRHPYKRLELDDVTLDRCSELIAGALTGGVHLTRKEIGAMLEGAGINVDGQRLPYILMNAELNGLICSGALNDKQHTYALVDEHAPNARRLDHEEALAEFVRRYFTSHGPATVKDLRAWSSLTIAEIKRGISMVESDLERLERDEVSYWFAYGPPEAVPPSPTAHILQGYDEYFMGYLESRHVADVAGRLASLHPDNMVANGVVVLESQVAGHWKRRLKSRSVIFEVLLYEAIDPAQAQAVRAAADLFGEFLRLPATVEVSQI
jgi:hypothetical protein